MTKVRTYLWASPAAPGIQELRFLSSLKLCASVSPIVKWGHWSRISGRWHSALEIYDDDAYLLTRCCRDKSSHGAPHRIERQVCDQKTFHLPWEEPENRRKQTWDIFPPKSPVFFLSFPSSFTESPSSPPLFHVYILFLLFFLPLSPPHPRFSLFPPYLSFTPFHLMSTPSLKRHLFSSGCVMKGQGVQNSSISHYRGSDTESPEAGLPQCSAGERPRPRAGRSAERRMGWEATGRREANRRLMLQLHAQPETQRKLLWETLVFWCSSEVLVQLF